MRSTSTATMCPVCGGVMLPVAPSPDAFSKGANAAEHAEFHCLSCGGSLREEKSACIGDATLREAMARAGQY